MAWVHWGAPLLFAMFACGSSTESNGGAGGAGGAMMAASNAAQTTPQSSTVTTTTGMGGGGAEPQLGPPYPIVLSHGFFGFEDFAGTDFVTYYFGVRDHLMAQGEPLVFTPAVDPFNNSTFRGAQLAEHIADIRAQTGYKKVNIIGHSQGGLDARVVAHDHPDWVASVITLQTPHDGSPIADIALQIIDDPALADLLDLIVQIVGAPLYDEVGAETSLAEALREFSTAGAAVFNATYPDQTDVLYASVAGRSDWHGGGSDCDTAFTVPFISEWDGERDPIDPLFNISETLLDGGLLDPYPNDGLVRVRDAKRGQFWGCVPADHMDMVGQLLGDSPGFGNSWSYLDFYADLVEFLRGRGL